VNREQLRKEVMTELKKNYSCRVEKFLPYFVDKIALAEALRSSRFCLDDSKEFIIIRKKPVTFRGFTDEYYEKSQYLGRLIPYEELSSFSWENPLPTRESFRVIKCKINKLLTK
jgi:hypothetical protein